MPIKERTICEAEFAIEFPLVPNHINKNAGWGEGGKGCLFETYGEELEFVRQQDPANIWTLIEGFDHAQYIVSGYHVVNRIGYLISKDPVPNGTIIHVESE